MSIRFASIALILALVVELTACSGGKDPVNPSLPDQRVAGVCDRGASSWLWGYWDVAVNPSDESVEIVPLRTAEFTCNVTVFLQPPLGSTANININIVDLSRYYSEGLIDVDVTLRHPFPGLDKYTGFDVTGVFIHHGDTNGSYDPSARWATGDGTAVLLNADGYTRWYNPVEFTRSGILGFVEGALGTKNGGFDATANPYRYYCDGLGATDDLTDFFHDPANVSGRGLFSPSVNTRRYELKFPMVQGQPKLNFQYAVVASWEPPEGEAPYDLPEDFPISANRSEAFQASVADNGSTLYYTDTEAGGLAKFKAEIFDWGALENLSGVMGEIGKVVLESEDINIPGGYLEMVSAEFFAVSEPGTAVSSVAVIELEGFSPLHAGSATFLMTIESSNPSTYDQGFGVPVPDSALASYFFFSLPVIDHNPCVPPVVALTAPDTGAAGDDIEFDATASTGTPPLTFDWDWNGDGTYDETTDTGLVTHGFSPGIWQIGLRVSNDCGEDVLDPMHEITITCPTEVHSSYLGAITCDGDFTSLRQDGTAFLPDGRILVKRQDSLVAYEVTTPGPGVGEVIIADMANAGMNPGGTYQFLANLDYDEVLDRIIYTTLYGDNERVTVYHEDSGWQYLTDFVLSNSGGVIEGVDTDGEGGIWCLYHTPAGVTGDNYLYHYEWNESSGGYDIVEADTILCNYVVGGARGIFDIAIIPEAQRLYIFHNDNYKWQGALYVVDISVSPPEYIPDLTKNQIFAWTGNVGSAIGDFNKWEGATIEVDHGDGTAETCRLFVQRCFQPSGTGIAFMKFDADLNELDHYSRSGNNVTSGSIRPGPEVSDRLFVAPTWTVDSCTLYVFDSPPGW